jgi:flagellar biosynthesis protein FlhF
VRGLDQPRRPPDESPLAHEVLCLKKDLEEARREMRGVCLRTRAERELELTPPQAELFGRLVNHGVEESLAEELLRQAAYDTSLHRSPQPLEATVRDLLAGRLIPGRAPWSQEGRRVIALVGPTGVGKTTTLAKIAAKALVESRLRVALITVDTYRVGGSEQLTRYGQIMRVPTFIAKDGAELTAALARCPGADLVLIDTSGRAVSEAVYRQAQVLRQVSGVALHLVLSAATGARELAAVAERYRPLSPERLIFSKIDEATAPGSVLSAAVRINRPVACVTDGQRVPEDIHAVTSEELTALAMGAFRPLKARAAASRS